MTAEGTRLRESDERTKYWKRWGPYLSERAWGTVREDYSADGSAWDYFPHDHARSRAYRWNEDGIAGICCRHQKICFSIGMWNGRDPILKERLFGLTGSEGNHGEDVKELYYYLDSTPTHSYMKYLYKYPQAEFPYSRLVEENARRGKEVGEFEILDTGVFDDGKYFDVFIEYAKADCEDILIKITAANRSNRDAEICLLPTVWFRNRWRWNGEEADSTLRLIGNNVIEIIESEHGRRFLYCDGPDEILFTENETNNERLFGSANATQFVKDGINDYITGGRKGAVNSACTGTKAAAVWKLNVPAGGESVVRLRMSDSNFAGGTKAKRTKGVSGSPVGAGAAFQDFETIFATRISEADEFYAGLIAADVSDDAKLVQRQAFAGILWSKQYYHYVVETWLDGDPGMPAPPPERLHGRNSGWRHLYNEDIVSMPDKWEYPWYAAWDLAFHCITLALVDSQFAKDQLILMLREWYMHPNGQIPAYEWAFGDVNPPVHAWSAMRVYQIEKKRTGVGDRKFLARVFQKLLLNFTWWVNRKDADGLNVFEGGFLGLDNIGVFDRSRPLPTGGKL
ncbi:MAG TPA: hypothetical protein VK468_04315, partial [Pyrinomonadaceae bacterium]|nr:hypothetical protein [Pyrinomonadaceae bacterium]